MRPVEIFIEPDSNSCFTNWFLAKKWRIGWQEEVAYSPTLDGLPPTIGPQSFGRLKKLATKDRKK
jgi:hypothetical protein